MAETLNFAAPTSTNVFDGGAVYNLAVDFVVAVAGLWTGVEWDTPTAAPGITNVASLWRVNGEELLAGKSFTPTVGELGTKLQILFDTPVVAVAGEHYRAAIQTDRFTGTFPGTWPRVVGNLTAGATNGWLHVGAGTPPLYPEQAAAESANYHVSPIFELGGLTGPGAALRSRAAPRAHRSAMRTGGLRS